MRHWQQLRVEPALCGRLRCQADWCRQRAASQRLFDHELWLVWAGRGWMQTHAGDFELRPGFCVWMRPGGIYDAQTDPRDCLGLTYIHFNLLAQQRGRWCKLDASQSAGSEFYDLSELGYVDTVCTRIVQLVNSDPSSHAHGRLACADLIRSLLIDLEHWAMQMQQGSTAQRLHRQKMLAVAATMRQHPADIAPVSILARRYGYSTAHFHDIFKQVHGISPQNYAIKVRIDRARQLLSESDLTISQIADILGYRDVYFFSRQFKTRTGHAPTDYRKPMTIQNVRLINVNRKE